MPSSIEERDELEASRKTLARVAILVTDREEMTEKREYHMKSLTFASDLNAIEEAKWRAEREHEGKQNECC